NANDIGDATTEAGVKNIRLLHAVSKVNLERGNWSEVLAIAQHSESGTIIFQADELASVLGQLPAPSAKIETERNVGGRPRNPDDDWAWEQVNELNRDITVVFSEWLNR